MQNFNIIFNYILNSFNGLKNTWIITKNHKFCKTICMWSLGEPDLWVKINHKFLIMYC